MGNESVPATWSWRCPSSSSFSSQLRRALVHFSGHGGVLMISGELRLGSLTVEGIETLQQV